MTSWTQLGTRPRTSGRLSASLSAGMTTLTATSNTSDLLRIGIGYGSRRGQGLRKTVVFGVSLHAPGDHPKMGVVGRSIKRQHFVRQRVARVACPAHGFRS